MKKIHAALAVLAITLPIFLSTTGASADTRSSKKEVARQLDIFNSLVKEMQMYYVDSIDIEKAINTAISSMLDELDPYTEYMPKKATDEFRSMTTGEYGGIGSYIHATPKGIVLAGPQEGSPAAEAGLRYGDLLLTINGDTVTGLTTEKVSELLQGTPGTSINVKVLRPYVTDSIVETVVTRRKIRMPSVLYSGMLPNSIGYITLSSFTDKSADEVKEALIALRKENHLKGLILDLRSNPGGSMEDAIEIVGLFVPKGTAVVTTKGKGVLNEKTYKTANQPVAPDLPLAVLVDGSSASSSELTAGAIQDLDRGVIIGNRSFGKGLVQTTRSLPYEGLLKVTVAKYYIPSGRLIQAIDYSHRNPDGTVSRVPDSLTNVFHTAGGREVRDGGGITPDITVEYPEVSRLAYNIVRGDWASDFATRYAAGHPSILLPDQFEVTDEIYEEFKNSIDPEKFQYDRVCEQMLKQLRSTAKIEGYQSDSLNAEFDRLEAMLKHPLSRDLDTQRKMIEDYLAREIVSRYYFTKGEIIYTLRNDNCVDTAITILSDSARYNSLLRQQEK